MRLTVVVFGATGTAGSAVVREALGRGHLVRAVTRRPLEALDGLEEVRCDDFRDLSAIEEALTGVDACFFCLGIAAAQARDEAHYRAITLDYAVAAARAVAKHSPGATLHHLSGQGADPTGRSLMMWARVKGEAEHAIEGLGSRLFIYRPGYIHPTTAKSGLGAAVTRAAFPLLRAVNAAVSDAELARAMLTTAEGSRPGGLIDNAAIRALAGAQATTGSGA